MNNKKKTRRIKGRKYKGTLKRGGERRALRRK
jgi:hypothetical protein